MTLSDLAAMLESAHADLPCHFVAEGRPIRGGWHLGEVQAVKGHSLLCSGARQDWTETRLHLVDGPPRGGAPMTCGKLSAILARPLADLPESAAAPLRVEFAPGHGPMQVYMPGAAHLHDGAMRIPLTALRTTCKAHEGPAPIPAEPATKAPDAATCCAPSA